MRLIRRVFWSVMLLLLLTSIALQKSGARGSTAVEFVFLMIAWWFVGGYISRWIAAMFLGTLRCKGCGFEFPAVGKWQIGQFTDHKERHVLLAKSPIDGMRVGHVNCPQCSTTIIV